MHRILIDNDKDIKAAKGIVKCFINKEFKHKMYTDILELG